MEIKFWFPLLLCLLLLPYVQSNDICGWKCTNVTSIAQVDNSTISNSCQTHQPTINTTMSNSNHSYPFCTQHCSAMGFCTQLCGDFCSQMEHCNTPGMECTLCFNNTCVIPWQCGSTCFSHEECAATPESDCKFCVAGKCSASDKTSQQTVSSSGLTIVSSFALLCFLLLIGKFLRVFFPPVQWLYLPASITGGFVGFGVISILKLIGYLANAPSIMEYVHTEWIAGWSKLGGFLINIVFASLFLGQTIPPIKTVLKQTGSQFAYGQIAAFGQFFWAFLITGAILTPIFGVPSLYAVALPLGFEGGHGSAAAFAPVLAQLGWKDGGDVCLAFATSGIVSAVVLGLILVTIARKTGIVKKHEHLSKEEMLFLRKGLYSKESRPSAGVLTTSSDSIDALTLHVAFIGLALLFGYVVKRIMLVIESMIPFLDRYHLLSGFPLFPLCMIGGMMIQGFLHLIKRDYLLDAGLMARISGVALDFTIVSSLALIEISTVAKDIVPFIVLNCVGILWNIFLLSVVGRFFLPNYWFERSITEFGQHLGVTSSGLLLLKMVDPNNETPTLSSFSFKQLLHEPIVSGMWNSISIPMVAAFGVWPSFGIATGIILFYTLIWAIVFRPLNKRMQVQAKVEEGEEQKKEDVEQSIVDEVSDVHQDLEMNLDSTVNLVQREEEEAERNEEQDSTLAKKNHARRDEMDLEYT